ncbi:hypothetical protein D4T97_003510 [Siminovitchia acidinfaciens]|uniref:Uncharacterized protein n=1 Tax=Siminovitchia acidinfaciens TaxID=2321395 RepID=A0A429Y8K3_9BACI|nr:hypothetical protein [Siminovitchia acidinfaciens]RST77755.1 hypothetical protein D4T97_003510 [Siminovitchia acidinfaciens]VEF46993.1 lipoprotein [Bacillus freudenreichii]
MPVTGWVISSIVAGVLGSISVAIVAPMNRKVVRDKWGKIDFTKTDFYFYWTRWDTIILVAAIYTFLNITGLLIFLLRGDNINSPLIQFFIHQTFVFSLITFIWLITKLIYVFKGIKARWPDEFK